MKYKLMTIKEIMPFLDDMEQYEVSQKARTTGFLHNYLMRGEKMLTDKSDQPNLKWEQKRNLFIDRTLPAYLLNPTYRRLLSLMAWAYMPDNY
jgi:hypothetical protein